MTEKSIRIRINNDKLYDYIISKPNYSEYLRDLALAEMNGKILDAEELQYKKEVQKLRKLIKENLKLDIDNKIKLIRELKITPSKAIKIASGEVELIVQDDSNEKTYTPPDTEYDKTIHNKEQNYLQCPQCGIVFDLGDTKESITKIKDDLLNHFFKEHPDKEFIDIFVEELKNV